MTVSDDVDSPPSLRARSVEPAARRWSWPQYLALVAIPVLIWETWTVVAWLTDHPHQVTQFRTSGSADWIATRVLEGLSLAVAIPVLIYVVRGCVRERRLTFDAMFCICAGSMCWSDVGVNFFQPTFLFSSNFVNLTNMCGHMPFVVNPDCGRVPDPFVFLLPLEMFGLLGISIVLEKPIRRARERWPGISTPRLLLMILGAGLVVDLLLEPVCISLGLWSYTAPAQLALHLGGGFRFAFFEAPAGAMFFSLPAAIRLFKDDSGHTFVERGLQHLSPGRQKIVTFLALYTAMQFIVWIPATVPDYVYGPFQNGWPKMPAYLVDDVCNAPGITGTRYGPCPGAPGYRLPGRHSLPGASP